jgi:ribosome-associated protein
MSDELEVAPGLVIPGEELVVTATHASGPGGQNVNKVATKIELRFDLARTTALPAAVCRRLRVLARNRLDADGRVVITSQLTRNRLQNLSDAREKLAALVRAALEPEKPRVPTRPTRASQRKRLDLKRIVGKKKQGRRVAGGRGEE